MPKAAIYLDYQATTPLAPDVLEVMLPYWQEKFGNPHSEHRFGWEAAAGIAVAREQIAALVGAQPQDIIFTSGATEANMLALRGVLEAAPAHKRRLVTLVSEHACVLETALDLEQRGFPLTLLGVKPDGLLDLDALNNALREDVALVSVMAVNNEIGVIQPIDTIAGMAHRVGALMHCDAAQALGKIPLGFTQSGIDLMSLSAHKCYGPKGIGALVRAPHVQLRAQMLGGGQEQGIRSGTLSPALCAGFGKACAIALAQLDRDEQHVRQIWQHFVAGLRASGVRFTINGSTTQRYFGNLNISFPDIEGARLLMDLRKLALSSGAACASAQGKASYVLHALGYPQDRLPATLRLGFGRDTSIDVVDVALHEIIRAVQAQHDWVLKECEA
jgi:cysteine desulfurase